MPMRTTRCAACSPIENPAPATEPDAANECFAQVEDQAEDDDRHPELRGSRNRTAAGHPVQEPRARNDRRHVATCVSIASLAYL